MNTTATQVPATRGIKMAKSKSAEDWVSQLMDEHCSKIAPAVAEVKDDKGKITTRAKASHRTTDLGLLESFAKANNITVKAYPNTGMARMNIGNMLRSAARKRGGLNVDGGFTTAAEGFEVDNPPTQDHDGNKIAKAPKATA